MRSAFLKIVTLVLLSSGLSIDGTNAKSPRSGPYEKVNQLAVQQIDLTPEQIQPSAFSSNVKVDCYFVQQNICLAVGVDRARNDHRTDDSGLRLFLVEKTSRGFKVRDRSRGSKDAYNLTPTFYRSLRDKSWVILAENGTEFTYGTRVFQLKGEVMIDLGNLNVGVKKRLVRA